MRILHVNKFLYRRGGAEAYMEDVAAAQESAGHTVAFFAMEHPLNRSSEFAAHFPARIELDPAPPSALGKAKAVTRMLYSPSARRGMEAVLDEFGPDVVHLHNIYHHLSPSILRPLARRRVPAVMTLHDYKLACPTYRFLDHGQICEACLGGRFYHAVLRRCNRGSLASSAVNALELSLHTVSGAYRPIQLFICPSRFIAGRMGAAGVFPDRLRSLPHFIDCTDITVRAGAAASVAYAGRLAREKGVDVLIEAVSLLDQVTLEVAGDGPERSALEALARRRAPGRVHFHGALAKEAMHDVLRSAAVVAVPSRWYENQPMIVLEAFACGVPVVATRLGGLPELVEPGVDGALVPANDPAALSAALREILGDAAQAERMGAAARAKVEQRYRPADHLAGLDDLYAEAARRLRRKDVSPTPPSRSGYDDQRGRSRQRATVRSAAAQDWGGSTNGR